MRSVLKLSIPTLLAASTIYCGSQSATVPAPTPYSVIHRESNERTWQRTTYSLSPSGQAVPHLENYKEVGNGICFRQGGVFVDSNPSISILQDGSGASTDAPCNFYCPADIYNGLIRLVTSDGQELDSEPIGLRYSSGDASVQIAWLTNSVGELISSNVVLYPRAFVGGLNADLLLTFRDSGLEQDAIIRSQPATTPQQLGLSGSATVQLITEFVNSPTPVQSVVPVDPQNGLQDTTLIFGSMRMIQGRAFQIGPASVRTLQGETPVYKSWSTTSDGRRLLVEQVPWQRVSAQLAALPRSASRPSRSRNSPRRFASSGLLPRRRPFTVTTNSLRWAHADFKHKPGLDIDYVTLDSAETNMTFAGDTTYFVNNSGGEGYCLDGTTTIEGGSVIKFPNENDSDGLLIINQNGTIDCQTAPFLPAVLTSSEDNSVGASISPGTPAYDDNLWILQINGTSASVHDLRFCYAEIGIGESLDGSQTTTINATNCQFIGGDIAVYAYNANLYNILIGRSTNLDAALLTEGPSLVGENITADGGGAFIETDDAGASVALTNCLITGQSLLTNCVSPVLSTNAVAWVPSPSMPIYATVGGASYYLANASLYREAGTTNTDPGLLADLATRTTWPPFVYCASNISSLGTLGPEVARDISSTPDLGYHYDCLDYVFAGCDLYSNLTVTAGTAVGWFETNGNVGPSQPYSISLNGDASLSFNGNATQPCIFARYPMVQEAQNGNWTGDGWMGGIMFNGGSPEPQLSANFTKFTCDNWNGNLFRDPDNVSDAGVGIFKNSELYNFTISTYEITSLAFTNCLFFRFNQSFWTSPNLAFENCTFYNGGIYLERSSPVNWLFENCTFDGTAFDWSDSGGGATTIDYDAYNTNNLGWQTYPYFDDQYGTNEVVGPDDLMTTNYNWEASWFGDFYLPTNSPLLQRGSTTANLLGLYHFTVQTNQTIDGDNIVTIGYHYVATDQYGDPLDSNGDGVPDYLEDPSGMGVLGPQITLPTPNAGTYYIEPATIPIQAIVSDWSGLVTNVDFLQSNAVQGAINIVNLPGSPYAYSWPLVAAGQYSLTGIAQDDSGLSATSAVVNVTVTNLCGF